MDDIADEYLIYVAHLVLSGVAPESAGPIVAERFDIDEAEAQRVIDRWLEAQRAAAMISEMIGMFMVRPDGPLFEELV